MNILFTSAGRRGYLIQYFRAALAGRGKIFAANSDRLSPALEEADEAVVTPLIYSAEYIPFLLDFCREHDIAAVIPLFDIDLPVLSRHKAEFAEAGATLIVSDPEVVELCNDKYKTYAFLKRYGFPAVPTFPDLEAAVSALRRGELRFPVVVKPRWGMGSLAIYTAEDEAELRIFYRKARRDIQRSYLKYEAAAAPDECVLVQQKLPGQEYGVDNISDLGGNYAATIIRRKLGMRSGETDCAEIVEHPGIRETARRLAGLTRHVAIMDIDIMEYEGAPYILDMNARFGGGYPFSHAAGADLPAAIIQWLRGEEADAACFRPRLGTVAQKNIEMLELTRAERVAV